MYDARQYGAGAFAELQVQQNALEKAIQTQGGASPDHALELSKAKWHSLSFNGSGNQLIAGAEQGMSIVLDGFEATVQRVFCPAIKSDRPAVSCFTPDDRTVLAGTGDGSITCYSVETGSVVKKLEGHSTPVGCMQPNPRYAQFASCCANTVLWTW